MSVAELGRHAKVASAQLGVASTALKNAALLAAADLLGQRREEILAANASDVVAAEAGGMESGPLDRLRLTDARIAGMADGLRARRRAWPIPSARCSTGGSAPTAS